jgi:5-methylcytosine-specific restriction enzyme subunit McrC
LSKDKNHISVFEHELIRFDKGEKRITEEQFKALEKHFGNGLPFYSLRYNGIQFNEHVGVIQIGKTVIEVLPKADKNETDTKKWKEILIGMLKAVGGFDIKATSNSSLRIKPNSILDLYFEMFIVEVEYLLHQGLIKKYHKKEGNTTALKGNLQFAKHIQQNLTHQERFYVRHTTYDIEHQLHFILYKTICLLQEINTHAGLHGRIGALLLQFPEMPDIKVSEATFAKLVFNRKNQGYKKVVEIAKLLLLQYHPDISRGRNHVLALMFDMNKLWEQFVYVSLRRHIKEGTTITAQSSKFFWKPENGYRSKIRPDIVLNKDQEDTCIVLDTKWKNLGGYNPSANDLRQMYVYHEYYGAKKVALVYPGAGKESTKSKGIFLNPITGKEIDKECSIISLAVESKIKKWQLNIYSDCAKWLNLPLKSIET